jgi:uncharacterized membrane protein YhaH (DUF805 family)
MCSIPATNGVALTGGSLMTAFGFRPGEVAVVSTPKQGYQPEISLGQFLFGFEGRIGRLPYILATTLLAIIAVIYLALLLGPWGLIQPSKVIAWSFWPWLVPTLPFIWMQTALLAKRYHDLGFSAWRYFGVYALLEVFHRVYLAASRVAKIEQNPKLAIVSLIAFALALIFLLWMFLIVIKLVFFKGQPHANDYGAETQQVRWR